MADIKKVKQGMYILHKNEPHLVLKNYIVTTGTHCHVKNKLDVKGLFSGKYEILTFSPHDNVEDVEIIRKKAQLLSSTNNSLQIMDLVSYETFEATADEEIMNKLKDGDEVTYIEFNNARKVIEKRG